MFKTFTNLEELLREVHADRNIEGDGSSTANRFPIRFVLFDNFRDCCAFVEDISHLPNIAIQRIEDWMDKGYPDQFIPHEKLAKRILKLIKTTSSEYRIIMPFSEIARFYNNQSDYQFDLLIKTIKGFYTLEEGFKHKQRIYIPIVGQEGKMQKFRDDSQSFIWYYQNADKQLDYRLILTNGTTYGVSGLDTKYTIANTLTEWLGYWKYPELKQNIISTSKSVFSHRGYANPDNAFTFYPCEDAYHFLTEGLNLDVKCIKYNKEEDSYWNTLASKININNFKFEKFFNEQFGIYNLADYNVFFETWFKHKQPFMRWLLAKYYVHKFCDQGYICRVLQQLESYSDTAFAKGLAISIFSLENKELYIDERSVGMEQCAKNDVELAPEIRTYLVEKIRQIEEKEGIISALKYVSAYTYEEKALIIEWYSNGKVSNEQLRELYPDLYYYLGKTIASAEDPWVLDYIDKYKDAKVKNEYTDAVEAYIQDRNKDYLQHFKWSNKFRTTRTIMNARTDIQCYYWIDGLGLDWIPFIEQIVKEKELEGYYLNEVYVATAKLPTVTDINKKDIDLLSGGLVEKYGDLDHSCHSCRAYPKYIIDDLTEVRKAIVKLLSEHPGEKIAIVSDHGISYLSQLKQGHNLKGYTSEHWGRIALSSKKPSDIVNDEKYTVVETPDGKSALCALKHDSLMAKIPEGMGAHGGCTPEEQLVPIIIISPEKTTVSWSATLKSFEVEEANPIVIYSILGLDNKQIPLLEYDGIAYAMNLEGGVYKSERLKLNKDVTKVTLRIGTWSREDKINIKLAVQEDDLFTF